jgi:hypothetical protein
MTSTTVFTAPSAVGDALARPSRRLWKTGLVAGASAFVATFGFAALVRSIDVPLKVGGQTIPAPGFAQLTLVASIIGTFLAVVMSRRAHRPLRTFVATTVGLTLVSIVPDVLADATTATKVALALSHLVAAAIVIPALASRLSD